MKVNEKEFIESSEKWLNNFQEVAIIITETGSTLSIASINDCDTERKINVMSALGAFIYNLYKNEFLNKKDINLLFEMVNGKINNNETDDENSNELKKDIFKLIDEVLKND